MVDVLLLERYFQHDDAVEEMTVDLSMKSISFKVSNYIEEKADYRCVEICFQSIEEFYLSNLDCLTQKELDILSFNVKEVRGKIYEFELLVHLGFGRQDAQLVFNCCLDTIQIKPIKCIN